MTGLGEACLLLAFSASGYGAFATIHGVRTRRMGLQRLGIGAGVVGVAALTVALGILVGALLERDFRFLYVKEYSSRHLPWYFAISAVWVGQAGSLLLWAWMLGLVALGFLLASRPTEDVAPGRNSHLECPCARIRIRAFGVLLGYFWLLTAVMVFAADPMARSVDQGGEGYGLSPSLQHPAMLIHPPIVFLAYAGWAVPWAILTSALVENSLDPRWVRRLRGWALGSWTVLGAGILLGAHWSYEELGWGGYWAWDPVENASLIPWLTGTAFVHALMAWRSRAVLGKTMAGLGVATFGLCNFASFLTRSGIFSSLHAFSRSPIGWLFLGFMAVLAIVGGVSIVARRDLLQPRRTITTLLGNEAMILVSTVALVVLATLIAGGTAFVAASEFLVGRRVVLGPSFYNGALVSSGAVLLLAIMPAPLLGWGGPPSPTRVKVLAACGAIATGGVLLALALGVPGPLALVGFGVPLGASTVLLARYILDLGRRPRSPLPLRLLEPLLEGRRAYSGFLAHLGFVLLTLGVTGSSLGTLEREYDLIEGDTALWSGHAIRFQSLAYEELADRRIVEARLVVTDPLGRVATLRPARHFHRLQEVWTTEADVLRRLGGDLYAVARHGDGNRVRFLFLFTPLVSCVWGGGWLIVVAGFLGVAPDLFARNRRPAAHGPAKTGRPKGPHGARRVRVGSVDG